MPIPLHETDKIAIVLPTDGKESELITLENPFPVTEKEVAPTSAQKNNASFAYSYNENGNLDQIDMTIAGIVYRKTFTWEGSDLISESAWSEV